MTLSGTKLTVQLSLGQTLLGSSDIILPAAKATTVLWLRPVGRVLRQSGDQGGWREYLLVLFHKAKVLWVTA